MERQPIRLELVILDSAWQFWVQYSSDGPWTYYGWSMNLLFWEQSIIKSCFEAGIQHTTFQIWIDLKTLYHTLNDWRSWIPDSKHNKLTNTLDGIIDWHSEIWPLHTLHNYLWNLSTPVTQDDSFILEISAKSWAKLVQCIPAFQVFKYYDKEFCSIYLSLS